ncbi:2'-5' RNA ligase family protein [Clostridium saccharoperbutylacetonicum]|jgi:2'-5' RNA ligase
MGYAIVGYFDAISDDKITTLWRGMADIGVDDYLINSANNPHIKFAVFDSIDLEFVQKEFQLLSKRIQKVSLHFKKYGIYPNDSPFITIDIADNIEIIKLHMEIQKIFNKFESKDSQNYFIPGIWKPDCQLTIQFDKAKLVDAINYLSQTNLPFDGHLEKIGLIEYHPAKQLFSYELA